MALSHPQRPDWFQLLEDHLGPIPVTEGSGGTFHSWPRLPEKVFLSFLPFYVKSSEEAPGSSQKHLPLPCPPPLALLFCTHPFAGPCEGLRVRSEGGSGACKARGRAGLSPGFLGTAALRLPCPGEAWPGRCTLSMGREDREGRGRPGQDNVRQGLGVGPASHPP